MPCLAGYRLPALEVAAAGDWLVATQPSGLWSRGILASPVQVFNGDRDGLDHYMRTNQ